MLLNLTEEQITQLAPDAASVKAGKGLANRTKWVLLEHSDRAIWGHCQGSGKTPYQTVVDSNVLVPAVSFRVNMGWGFYLCMLPMLIFSRKRRNRTG